MNETGTGDGVAARLEAIRRRIARAEKTAGRPAGAARLVAVSKTFDAEAIREWTRGHLTAYKVPKTIVPFDTLPRSLVGKVQRREVREELLRRRAR